MINSMEFSARLQKIIDYYGESASSFAEKIGVQRSSISHILSGRNKPSLDFILKILNTYPEVELYWLLNGKGSFPIQQNSTQQENERIHSPKVIQTELPLAKQKTIKHDTKSKTIQKIVIFYSDGTFESFIEIV